MTIVATEDNRNLEWRKNNVGSALLQKMGWKEGEGVGKRSKSNTTALRALKRKEGLGLGAKIETEGGNSESSNHFTSVLENLKAQHPNSSKKEKRKKAKLVLPQNKVTAGHAQKMREAKFGKKSAKDMACIFGNQELAFMPVVSEETKKRRMVESEPDESDGEKKREKKRRKKDKKKKKKEKKEKRAS